MARRKWIYISIAVDVHLVEDALRLRSIRVSRDRWCEITPAAGAPAETRATRATRMGVHASSGAARTISKMDTPSLCCRCSRVDLSPARGAFASFFFLSEPVNSSRLIVPPLSLSYSSNTCLSSNTSFLLYLDLPADFLPATAADLSARSPSFLLIFSSRFFCSSAFFVSAAFPACLQHYPSPIQ